MGFAASPEQDPLQMGVARVVWMKEIGELNARTNRLDADLSADPLRHSCQATQDPLVERFRGACQPSPYDDRPFEWSAADTAIRFRGLAEGERGVHLLYH